MLQVKILRQKVLNKKIKICCRSGNTSPPTSKMSWLRREVAAAARHTASQLSRGFVEKGKEKILKVIDGITSGATGSECESPGRKIERSYASSRSRVELEFRQGTLQFSSNFAPESSMRISLAWFLCWKVIQLFHTSTNNVK